jgi:anti-sigma factor (TIGR02949 family)
VDCKESLSLLSAAVDEELEEPQRTAFFEHLAVCPDCKAEYELELMTKRMVKQRLKKVKAPKSLVDAIRKQSASTQRLNITRFATTQLCTHDPQWKMFLVRKFFLNETVNLKVNTLFAVLLGIIVLGMLTLGSFMKDRRPFVISDTFTNLEDTKVNIYDLTLASFQKLNPNKPFELVTTDEKVIANYLTAKLGEAAFVPKVQDFTVKSARLAAFGGMNVGEILYKHNSTNHIVCIYVAKSSETGLACNIPDDVMAYISQDGKNFHQEACPNGHHVLVWKWGGTLYTAVSDVKDLSLATIIRNPNWVN